MHVLPTMSLPVCGEQSPCLSDLRVLHGVIATNAWSWWDCHVLVKRKFTVTHSPSPSRRAVLWGHLTWTSREGPVVNLCTCHPASIRKGTWPVSCVRTPLSRALPRQTSSAGEESFCDPACPELESGRHHCLAPPGGRHPKLLVHGWEEWVCSMYCHNAPDPLRPDLT